MSWETRTYVNRKLSDIISIPGDKPTVKTDINALIRSLEHERDKGVRTVSLDGLGTLHAEGAVILATESQI